MAKFFYGIKRRRGEGMNAWIVRHDEALLEAKRTLAEAIQEYGPGMQPPPPVWDSSWKAPGSKQGGSSRASAGSRASDREQDLRGTEAAASATASGEATVEESLEEEPPEWPEDDWEIHSWNTDQWHGWRRSWWNSRPTQSWDWEYGSHPEGYWGAGTSHYGGSHASWDASTAASAQADRFLPDFVIAWLLLQRSGLDASERSVLVANLKNDFSVQKVKDALRLTWPDEELKRRDSGKHTAMFTEEESAMLAEDESVEDIDAGSWEDPEDEQAYQALAEDAQEALAAIYEAKRTLKDAREKQAQMRRNRRFYPSKGGGKGRGGDKPPPKCFKCGGPHFRRDCPENTANNDHESRVNFVFTAFETGAAESPWQETKDTQVLAAAQTDEQNLLALNTIIQEGKAIIDGGATSSLGSEEALQQIAQLNWTRTGDDGIQILKGETPSFRFGNNARHECMATALVKLPFKEVDGRMKVHVHDIPGQPVLLSVKSLRSLGAVIDFGRDEAIFRALDPSRVVPLETTDSGHQLFPMVGDVLQNAVSRSSPFTSLHENTSSSISTEAPK